MVVEAFSPNCDEIKCCKEMMQPFIDHINTFTVHLVFNDGNSIDIRPWVISEIQEFDDKWIAIRQNTPEYEDVDTANLTLESRIFLYARHHHWGIFTVHKVKVCPLKR
jgi:hypothetical protein